MNDREELNQLGEQWYSMSEQGNEAARLAVRLALCEKIFDKAFRLFPKHLDAMGLFFEKDWDKFDPGKGDLYGFLSCRLKMREKDMDKQDFDGEQVKEKDADTGKERRGKKRHPSLCDPIGEDGSTLGDTISGDAGAADSGMMIDECVLEVLTLMFDLKDRLGGSAGNPVRINYFRLFFTDGAVDAIQSGHSTAAFARRERDLFRVIKVSFLDFFMSRSCRDVAAIADTELKLYGRMVEGRPMEPPKQPFPNDVYTTYLRQAEHYTATASAVSQQRAHYEKFLKEQLQC